MPLNEKTRLRPRWPVQFDIEGVPRKADIRNQLLTEILEKEQMPPDGTPEENAMQVVSVTTPTLDFNNPKKENYKHQEYPRMTYRIAAPGAKQERLAVANAKELEAAIVKGFHMTEQAALDALGGSQPKPVQAISNAGEFEDEDDVEDLPLTTQEKTAVAQAPVSTSQPTKKKTAHRRKSA